MRRARLGLLVLVSVSLALIAAPSLASQGPKRPVYIATKPRELQLRGELESGDLTGTLRLRASSALPATDYYFLIASDLKGQHRTVGREHVTVADPVDIPACGARDFTVTVSGLLQAGTYRSSLQIVQIADPRHPVTVKLVVIAERQPAPKVARDTPIKLAEIKLINPKELHFGWKLVGLLALLVIGLMGYWRWRHIGLLLPLLVVAVIWFLWARVEPWASDQLENGNNVGIDLDNPLSARLPVVDGIPLLRRDLDGLPVQGLTLQASKERSLAEWDPDRDRTLLVSLDPALDHPGHYSGQILLELVRTDTRFAIPIELSLRIGPLLPLLVLLLSILGGYGVRRVTFHRLDEEVLTNDLKQQIENLADRTRTSPTNELAELLIVKLSEASRLASAGNHLAAHERFADVDAALNTWKRIRVARDRLPSWLWDEQWDEQRQEAMRLLEDAEGQCRQLNIPLANATLDRLDGRLWAWEHLKQFSPEDTTMAELTMPSQPVQEGILGPGDADGPRLA
jgi:hypothetical protein